MRVALRKRQIAFVDYPIADDPIAEQFVTFISYGFRSALELV
ncbi:hypothetical protein [Chloroflexus sp.]|nr:hypothetical protein [Chloroflexus sp.]MDW8404312.1 hypothetical protein [Chloroflexus sp.]